MRISELAGASGVPASTLRFYEGVGLLSAGRTGAGYRVYGPDAVERLRFIGVGKGLGLSLEEVRELLGVWEGGICGEVKAGLKSRVGGRLGRAEVRLGELGEFVATLRAALRRFEESSADAGPCDSRCGCFGPATELTADSECGSLGTATALAPGPASGSLMPATRLVSADAESDASVEHWSDAPVACSLRGRDMVARIEDWHSVLEGAVRTAISEGVRLSVPAERAARVAELVVAEQKCCSFFDFRIHFRGAFAEFEVRAPAEAAGILAEVFGGEPDPDRP